MSRFDRSFAHVIRRTCTGVILLAATCGTLAAQPSDDIPRPKLPASGVSLRAFIPSGWKGIDTAYGDLNKDGRSDCALVIEHVPPPSSDPDHLDYMEENPRILAVLLADGTGYTLACQSNTLMLMQTEGGVMGDPFDVLEIERGTLVVGYWGGSNEKWHATYRFRRQDGGWHLIGATTGGGNALHSHTYDFNLLTGKIEGSVVDDEHPRRNERWTKRAKLAKLPRLESFRPWSLKAAGIDF